MTKNEGQLCRSIKRCRVQWDEAVVDPRDPRGCRHRHHGLLNLLVFGFAAGASSLRRIEELAEDLSVIARRLLQVRRRVSDNALYMVLARQKVEGLRQTLVAQVKAAFRNGRLKNDLFRFGVVAFDGKSTWTSPKPLEGAKASSRNGVPFWSLASERAVLVSSSVAPVLDVDLIPAETGESQAFQRSLPRVAETFGTAFDIITADAGIANNRTVERVRELGKHYLLGLKGNWPGPYDTAKSAFDQALPILAQTTDLRSGERIVRKLSKVPASSFDLNIVGAEQLLCVVQDTYPKQGEPKRDVRFFLTSIPASMLTDEELLRLVRLHWGIENRHNWTLDTILEEDDRSPCQRSKESIEVVCWLRMLAYNIVALRRQRAPKRDRRAQPWRRILQKLRDLLVFGFPDEEAALAVSA